MLKKLNSQIVIAIIALSCPPLHAQVKADISAKEVDKIKGTLRVRDLVVNDTARVYGGTLCIKDSELYLPDSTLLSDKPVDDWGVDLKITVLPGRKIRATTVLPKTSDAKRMKDSIESFLSSNLMPSIFGGESQYCNKRESTNATGTKIKYLQIESIDGLHSLRKVYEQLKKKTQQ
jgi:hypothetical protein